LFIVFFSIFDSFDITFGKEVLIANAELTMAYGRKYGLIGRNGSGSKKNK
jgi:ATP-binding cassette subfamily F protein 3